MLIDACQLGPGHSSFLQQAAYLSGGTYLKPARPQALVQYLNVSPSPGWPAQCWKQAGCGRPVLDNQRAVQRPPC